MALYRPAFLSTAALCIFVSNSSLQRLAVLPEGVFSNGIPISSKIAFKAVNCFLFFGCIVKSIHIYEIIFLQFYPLSFYFSVPNLNGANIPIICYAKPWQRGRNDCWRLETFRELATRKNTIQFLF